MGGQFEPKLVVNLHRNWVVNLTVFSSNPQNTLNFPCKALTHLKSFVRIKESITKNNQSFPYIPFSVILSVAIEATYFISGA